MISFLPCLNAERAASGSADRTLAAVYDAHAAGLYQYALMILADPSNAEDAVQQSFANLTVEQLNCYVNNQARRLETSLCGISNRFPCLLPLS